MARSDWVKTAAAEIYRENKIRVAAVKDGSNFAPFLPESIEAIILKHCPEEQAAEKLVEGIKSIASVQPLKADPRFYELNGGPIGVIAKMVREARITIAEYEKATKRPPSEEAHTPGSSGEPPRSDQADRDELGIERNE